MLKASDIMTTNVITVNFSTSVSDLAKLLADNTISGAPVIDDENNILGVVTENDLIDQAKKIHIPTVVNILDSFIYLENPNKIEKEMKKIAGTLVADICADKPVTVSKDTPIDEIATIMAEDHIHTLPVEENGKLIGVIGKRDLIRTLIS